jgi:hypothetical protein
VQTHNGRPLPLSPGASDLRGHKAAGGRIRGLADRMGQREHGQKKQLMSPRKLSVSTLYSFNHKSFAFENKTTEMFHYVFD